MELIYKMSLFIYKSDIIDRDIESDEIANYICSQREKNRILWVCADTGIGKTSLIKKALKKQQSTKTIISVNTPPVNSNNCISQGQYLSYIASSTNDNLKAQGGSLKDFVLSGVKNRIGKAEIQRVLESDITKIPQTMISTIISRYAQTGVNDVEQYLMNTDINSTLVQREYLRYSLMMYDCIIYISNMQNIDVRSLNELEKLIATTENTFFLFEFTTQNNNLDNVHKYNETFQENADIAIEVLDLLPINFATSFIGNTTIENYQEWENYYKTIICGNLYKLQNIDTKTVNSFSYDPLEKLYNLELEGLVILQTVILHDGEISLMRFHHIFNKYNIQYLLYFENHFDDLSAYLEKSKYAIKLIHSSVKDFLLDSTNLFIDKSRLIAYGILRDVFNEDLANCNYNWYTKKELVLYLVKLYSASSTEKIIEILEKFKELIVDEIAIEQINLLFDQLSKEIDTFFNYRIILKIIKICYDFGLYWKAYEFLTNNFQNNINFYMYKAILLNRLDKHSECINFCNIIENESKSHRFLFTIQLIKMLSLRTLNKKYEYRHLYYELLNNNKYKNCLEYGFLLRNSEILYSPVKDIPYIKRSIEHFRNHQNIKNEVYAQITLATEYAYAGSIKKAKDILHSIKDDFLKTTTEKHIYYNDIAAVELQGKCTTDTTLINLEQGLLSSRNSYDTLTIFSNKICWYIIEQKIMDDIETFKMQLDYYIKIEPDLRICKRIYFNMYQYYKYIVSDSSNAQYYWQKVISMRQVLDDKLDKMVNREKTKSYIIPQVYVSFITYWHFDIPNL